MQDLTANSGVSAEQGKFLARDKVNYKRAPDPDSFLDEALEVAKLGTKTEIQNIQQDLADIFQLTGNEPLDLQIIRFEWADRASARPKFSDFIENQYIGGEISIGNSYTNGKRKRGRSTLYHEYSHHLEFEHPEIAKANRQWVKNRATGEEKQLPGYPPGETAFPDHFIDEYVGKVYKDGYTEVLSMGVEHFVNPRQAKELYSGDREHFFLTLGSIIEIQHKNRDKRL